WVEHPLLKSHSPAATNARATLRRFGIRTATDLEDAFDVHDAEYDKLARLLNENDKEPSCLLIVQRTMRNEPNLFHVRRWKSLLEKLDRIASEESVVGAHAAPPPPAGGVAIAGDRLITSTPAP